MLLLPASGPCLYGRLSSNVRRHMEPIGYLLAAIGGQAALLALLAFLGRGLLSQVLARELEAYKSQLSLSAAQSIESFKNDLQLRTLERQITFSKFHERRADAVAQLYERLVYATDAAHEFVWRGIEEGSTEWHEKYRSAVEAAAELHREAKARRIYLPGNVAESIERYARRLHFEMVGLAIYAKQTDEQLDGAGLEKKQAAYDNAHNFIQEQLPEARKSLEAEFTSILGVTRDA